MPTPYTIELRRPAHAAPHGVHGLVDHLLAALAPLGRGLDRDLALLLTGAAFRTYQFVPADNWGWDVEHPDERWRWQTLDVENYGVIEALSAHASADIRRWEVVPNVAAWLQVVAVERKAARPLLARAPGSPATFWLTPAAHRSAPPEAARPEEPPGDEGQRPEEPPGDEGQRPEEPPGDEGQRPEEPPGDEGPTIIIPDITATLEEPLPLEALFTVRDSPTPTPPERLPALWKDVLVFATRHATSKKELAHHEELFYASGVRAWHATAELLASAAPGLDAYWTAWRDQLVDARSAGARALRRLPEAPGIFDTDAAVRARLEATADALAAVADQVAALASDPADVSSSSIDRIVDTEVRAIAELTLALRGLP